MSIYWKDILNKLDNGKNLKMPKYISKPFYWRTSPLTINQNSVYLDEFVETNSLPSKNYYEAFLDPPISLHLWRFKTPIFYEKIGIN